MIIESILVMSGLGLGFGVFLAFASKKYAVKSDPRITQVLSVLPGNNCGACGYPGCAGYAEAVCKDENVATDLCSPGGQEVADNVSKVVCRECDSVKEQRVAKLHCAGGIAEAKTKYNYKGVKTCKSAAMLAKGPKACSYGCIGFGDCAKVCNFNALHMGPLGLPLLTKENCVACNACVKECPKNLFSLVPKKSKVHVLCSSNDKAADVIKSCKVGCISCKRCEMICPVEGKAIHVNDNLAKIDYSKCISCGKCVEVCPRKIIINEKKKN
jgi:Na+-translocating ferredoxin:NAD+ oxidoreductase subunit B